MSQEAKATTTILIGVLGVIIAFFAWRYPSNPQLNTANNSNTTPPITPANTNSQQNENKTVKLQNNTNDNTTTLQNSNVNSNNVRASPMQVLARHEERGVLIECYLCKLDGNAVSCEFTVENESPGDRDIWLFSGDYYDKGSRMYDESNNEYKASVIRFGNKDNGERSYVKLLAVPHQKIRATIKFKEVDPQIRSISLLKIRIGIAETDQHIFGDLDRSFYAELGGAGRKLPIAK